MVGLEGSNTLAKNRPSPRHERDRAWRRLRPSAETLEVTDGCAAHEEIVLPGFSRWGQGKVRLSRPEVAHFAANGDTAPNPYIQAESALKDACSFRFAGIGPARDEAARFREMSEPSTKAHPTSNCRGGE